MTKASGIPKRRAAATGRIPTSRTRAEPYFPRAAAMKKIGGPAAIAALLSFNGGFVDTAGFLGLAGLFTAHVTGNFVTLGAALVLGSHGIIGKILALPVFIVSIALARFAGAALRKRHAPVLRIFLAIEVALLFLFFALAV